MLDDSQPNAFPGEGWGFRGNEFRTLSSLLHAILAYTDNTKYQIQGPKEKAQR